MSGVRLTRRTLIGAGAALPLILSRARAAGSAPRVDAPAGRFEGERMGNNTVAFRGIAYGMADRFCAPRPLPRARDIISARDFGPSCPQRSTVPNQREACLTLNIWTTAPRHRAGLPVMVYFHGGAYSNGTVVDPLVDGTHLAAQSDVVVVTVNHRLNALGYLYLAPLDPRFPDSGNLGQLDLILALGWIRENIAAFGGDPMRVMVFGQSGGGAKIATLMSMPAAKGLFHSAATMSGQQVTVSGPQNALRRTRAFLDKLNAEPDDLIDMPIERLIDGLATEDPILGGPIYMGPVLDMRWLMRHPFWPDADSQSRSIPMILGNTHDETRAFIDPRGPKLVGLDWDNLAERLASELRIDLSPHWIVNQYRTQFPDWSAERIFYAATTAGRSWPGQVIEADARAAAGAAATWVYQFDYQSPIDPMRGAAHTDDIPFVFGTLDAPRSFSGTGADARRLSTTMQRAFVNLAQRGNPNGEGVPDWPGYTLPRRTTLVFDKHSRAADDPRGWERALFARAPYIQPGS